MSVPILSQSGAKSSFRVQLWRSAGTGTCRHVSGGGIGRIFWEEVVELDFHVGDARERRPQRKQPSKSRLLDQGQSAQGEVVGRLGLDMACTGRARQRRDQAVGAAGAEEEWVSRSGP